MKNSETNLVGVPAESIEAIRADYVELCEIFGKAMDDRRAMACVLAIKFQLSKLEKDSPDLCELVDRMEKK